MTDAWDPSIPEHKALAHEVEIGNGIPEVRPIAMSRQALRTVGFQVEHEEDLAERPDEVRWYYPLEGNIWNAQTAWDLLLVWGTSWSGQLVTHSAMKVMEMIGLLPKGTQDVVKAMKVARTSLIKGGQTKVMPVFFFLFAPHTMFVEPSS
jgi:sterol 24-C-methyltransferase